MKIGIDLGGSHIAIGVVTDEGKIIEKKEENIDFIKQEPNNIKELIRDKILSLINYVTEKLNIPIFVIEEIHIGVPGTVENNFIVSIKKYNIYNWNLAEELEKCYKIKIRITNDAVASAIAEKNYGSLKNAKKAVFLCLGTGIGGATILDDKIFPSEYGHMVIEKNGETCHCGKRGCFETYCSMRVFKTKIIELLNLNNETTSEEILEILKEQNDNEQINRYIDEYIDNLLVGISNIVNIINPEKICIGGSFTYFEDILYKRLLEKAKTCTSQYKMPEIVIASLKNDAGIIG